MRRILFAVLILLLPSATAIVVYLMVSRKAPTNPNAVGRVVTIAGAAYPGTEDGSALAASFSDPFGIAVDRRGNVYVADAGQSNRIRRINTDGRVDTVAGSTEGFEDASASRAQFNTPSGLAIDRKGNIIVADTSNNRIRRIAADGKVTTLAGSGERGYKDGPAREAQFDGPIGIAIDKRGNVFVADAFNDRIRMISANGGVITIAGAGTPGSSDGNASTAKFHTPSGVAVDEQGNVFAADTGNSAIRKITPQGEVSTVLLRTAQETNGRSLSMRHPVGIVITHDGFLFVSDSSHIVRINPDDFASEYAGSARGFADGAGNSARFSGPAGLALDREGKLYVADSKNYLIRQIEPTLEAPQAASTESILVQPSAAASATSAEAVVPHLDLARLNIGSPFPWPLEPRSRPHEVTGVMGEARGAAGGVALDHIHSGLDIRGEQGEPILSVMDEKVSSPVAASGFGATGEGIQVGLMTYIHLRVGRNARDDIQSSDRFEPVTDSLGKLVEVRVRRGTRFNVGDFIGTVNRMYHVHLNLGPSNAQANPAALPFPGFKDTTPPIIESNGIEIADQNGAAFAHKEKGRLVISGDVRIIVTAYDRVDGNLANRKLGLYRAGYQLLDQTGKAVNGFEQPLINIEFNRLPSGDSSVFKAYAEGSGVSAYGMPTKFKYIVTNRVRDGEAINGVLRTSSLAPGNYILKVIAEDYAGNRASGASTELAITVRN